MNKFHINPNTGGISRCSARSGNCPFGGHDGSENHYSSISEAKKGYETMMEKDGNAFKTHSKSGVKEMPDYGPEHAKIYAEYQTEFEKYKALSRKIRESEEENENIRETEGWFNAVQERKETFYRARKLEQDSDALLPKNVRDKKNADEKAATEAEERRKNERRAKRDAAGKSYDFHPDITETNEKGPLTAIMSYSGYNEVDVREMIAKYEDDGLSKTEAYRKVWGEVPMRQDKPFVTIDLEVASSQERGKVDMGPKSSIIEVGYVKRWPDGRTEEKSYLCGISEDLRAVDGTGAEHIHKITEADVEGQIEFTEDAHGNAELREALKGSVMVAHNARYETTQFSYNLSGFNSLMADEEIEVLDTRAVCESFIPESENNSNKSFVEATGGKYEGAHRALSDAKMTLDALYRHKKVDTPPLIKPPA